MKKTLYISMLAVASLIACSKVVEERVPDVAPHGESREITLVASTTLAGADTKAVFEDNVGFHWEDADLTNFCVSQGGGNVKSKGGSINPSTGEAQITANVSDGTAYVGFPYNESGAGIFDLGENQTVTAGTFSGLKLASDAISITSETTEADIKFHLVGHLLRFLVYDSEGSSENVRKIAVSADKTIGGTYTYNFSSKTGSVTSGASTEVKAILSSPLSMSGITDSEKPATVFVPIVPVESAMFVYAVTTDDKVYTFTSASAKTRAEGNVTEIKLNLSNANAVCTAKADVNWYFRENSGYGVGVSATSLTVGSSENSHDVGYFFAKIGGENPGSYKTHELYNSFRYEAVDGSDAPVSWLSFHKSGDNRVNVDVTANESSEARIATLKVYFDGDITNYKDFYTDGNKIDPATEPIFTMTVTQNGVPAVHTIEFKFLQSTYDPKPASFYDIDAASHLATYARFETYVDGDRITADGHAVTAALRFQIDDGVKGTEEASNDWLRAYRWQFRDLNFQINQIDSGIRQSVVKVYLSGDFYSTYTVTSDGNSIPDENTPLYTTTVSQSYHQVIYNFYAGDYPTINYPAEGTLPVSAGSFHTGGQFWVRVDGGSDTREYWNTDFLTNFRVKAYDSTTGDPVDWVTGVQMQNDSNQRKLEFSIAANGTGSARTARIRVYADNKGDYAVIGRVNSGGSVTYFRNVADDDDKYVLEITVTQPGA